MVKRIGITGGIGSGKTTVCKVFETLGIPVYYADIEAKKIIVSNPLVKHQVKELLGAEAYHKNGKLNRAHVSEQIFGDKNLLKKMNAIVHPAVQTDSERWFAKVRIDQNPPYALKEAALLVENGSYKYLDALIVVTCPEQIRIQRVMQRDHLTYEQVSAKVKSQLPEEEKIAVANFTITNDGFTSIIDQVLAVHHKISR
jgi:dephospho-CoA kinase